MADLKLNRRWERYAPELDGNDALERPFFFELACGLTRAELRKLDDDVKQKLSERTRVAVEQLGPPPDDASETWAEQFADKVLTAQIEAVAEVIEPFVRLGSEPLTIAGKPIKTVREYLDAVAVVADQEALLEPLRALRRYNTLEGRQQLFSKRLSGGASSTRGPSAAKGSSQRAAH